MRTYHRSPTVGRTAELEMMEAVFRDVSGQRMRTLLVAAEAGGGKSRLIEEFIERLDDRALVLCGECIGQRQYPLSLAPVRGMLNDLIRTQGLTELEAFVSADDRSELARLLPEFGAPSTPSNKSAGRAMLFEVLRRLFADLARREPLVLVVEDAHWADQATVDLLGFLIGRLSSASVLLLISYRPEGVGSAGALRTLVADVFRSKGAHLLELPRLSRSEVAAQLEGILGHQPRPGLVNQVFERGGGVPLFTEALLTATGNGKAILPGSLRDFLLMAVGDLPERTRTLLRAASLGGPRIPHPLLARVTEQSDANLAEVLRPAVEAGVLVTHTGAYAFRHALIGDAIRTDLLAGEIIAIHQAYASAMESLASCGGELSDLMATARHWAGAGDASKAISSAWRASRQSGCAFSDQLEMLEIIRELWSQADDPEGALGLDRIRLLELATDAACWAAESERGLELVEQGLAEIGAEGRSESRSALLLQRAMMRQQCLSPGEMTDLHDAIGLASANPRLRTEALGQTCRALYLRDRHEEAPPLLDEMRQLASALGDWEFQLEADIDEAFLLPHGSKRAAYEKALTRATDAGAGRLEVLAAEGLLRCLCDEGNYQAAISCGWTAFDRTLALGQGRYMGAAVGYHLCQALITCGEIEQAADICERMAAPDPLPLGLARVIECRADIALARGDLGRALQCLRMLRDLPRGPQMAERRAAIALRLEVDLAIAKGDPPRACQLSNGTDMRRPKAFHWPLVISLVRAGVEAKQMDLLTELCEVAKRLPTDGAVNGAYALNFTAEVSRSAQSSATAWNAASCAWGELGALVRQAYCQVRSGAAQIAAGKRSGGGAEIRRAIETAGKTGATALISDIENIASRARVRLNDEGRGVVPVAPHGLTDREIEVLRLVASGHSNRQIASALFISPKTASVHVSNILSKLDAPTRNVAAAIAHRLQMVGPV